MAKKNESKSKTARDHSQRKKHESEVLKKLPSKTQPAEEWGERLATGKAIATGGKTPENNHENNTEKQGETREEQRE